MKMKMKEKIIRIKDIIISRILPFLLIFGIVFHFNFGISFAFNVPENEVSLDDLRDSLIISSSSSTVSIDEALSHVTGYSQCVSSWYADSSRTTWCCFISESGYIAIKNGTWYISQPNTYMYFGYYDTWNATSFQSAISVSTSSFSIDGLDYYSVPISGNFYLYNAYSLYYSSDFYFDNNVYETPNLTLGSYLPDTRVLQAEKVSRFGSDYISILTNDSEIGFDSFVSVSGLSGSNFVFYTYPYSSFIDVTADPPYTSFYLDPSLIGLESFSITSIEYENRSGSFGSLTINTSLVFGPPQSTVVNNYDSLTTINSFTQFVDEGSISYGLDTLYLGSDSMTGLHFYWSSSSVPTRQIWELKTLFIPNPSLLQHYTGQATISASTAYQIYEQFDLIIFGIDDDAFDYIYGSGQFSILDNITTGLDYDLLIKKCVELSTDYSNLRMDELAPTNVLYIDSDCGFVFTRSFLLKKMYFFMGDIDTRLLEFETNLVSENGVLAAVQEKLANIVTTNSSYFDLALPYLDRINYFCNDITLNGYLPAMVSSLGSIDQKLSLLNYLTSIDSKLGSFDFSSLSYLSDLDTIQASTSSMSSDLTYISSDSANIWSSIDGYFPNFYDYLFDIEDNTQEIISILYDMHETIIVDMDLPTIIFNDGDLVDFGNWINDWIVVLPEFDFSEFPDFFSNASNLITDIAGQNDDLIGSLDDPYTYSDSEVHSLGWD